MLKKNQHFMDSFERKNCLVPDLGLELLEQENFSPIFLVIDRVEKFLVYPDKDYGYLVRCLLKDSYVYEFNDYGLLNSEEKLIKLSSEAYTTSILLGKGSLTRVNKIIDSFEKIGLLLRIKPKEKYVSREGVRIVPLEYLKDKQNKMLNQLIFLKEHNAETYN